MTATRIAPNPTIPLTGTHNFRHTGGYPAAAANVGSAATNAGSIAANGRTRSDGLFRSDALHRLDAAAQAAFTELGIARIVDLRGADEISTAPNALPIGTTEQIHHPIFDSEGLPETGGVPSLPSVYRYVLEERADRLAAAVALIADAPEGAVLVHCTAGKDRTGLVVAVALAAVGVPREHVVADYAVSAENLAGEWAERMLAGAGSRFGELDDTTRDLIVASPAAAMELSLDLIEQLYGSAEGLLRAHGLGDAQLASLRSSLVG